MANLKMTTLKDLEKEFEIEGKIIRRKVRNLGYKASKGKGSPHRYEWESNSLELKKIREALKEESAKGKPKQDKAPDNKVS